MHRFSFGLLLSDSILKPSRLHHRLQLLNPQLSRESNPLRESGDTSNRIDHNLEEYRFLFVWTSLVLVIGAMLIAGMARTILADPGNDWDLAVGFTIGWLVSMLVKLGRANRYRQKTHWSSIVGQVIVPYLGAWGISLFFQGQFVERFLNSQLASLLTQPIQLLNVSWPFVVGSLLGILSLSRRDYPGGIWGLSAIGSVAAITFGMPGDATGYALGGMAFGVVAGLCICTYPSQLNPVIAFSLLFLFLWSLAVVFTIAMLAIFLCGGLFAITFGICVGARSKEQSSAQTYLIWLLTLVVGLAYYVPTQDATVLYGTSAGFVVTFYLWSYCPKENSSHLAILYDILQRLTMAVIICVTSIMLAYVINQSNPLRTKGGFAVKRPGKDLLEICQYAVPSFAVALLVTGSRMPLWFAEVGASIYYSSSRQAEKGRFFLARNVDELVYIPVPREQRNLAVAWKSRRALTRACLQQSVKRSKVQGLTYLESYLRRPDLERRLGGAVINR